MDVQILIELLNKIANTIANYKCYALNQQGNNIIGYQVSLSDTQLMLFMKTTLQYLAKYKYSKMKLGTYPEDTPKEYIETFKDISTNEFLESIRSLPYHLEPNATDFKQYKSYVITTTLDGKDIMFFTRKKLLKNYTKRNFIFSKIKGEYNEVTDALIHLTMHFDCIFIDDTFYIITIDGRELIGLTDSNKKRSLDILSKINSSSMIADDQKSILFDFVKGNRIACLANADEKLIEIFQHITKDNKAAIEKKYGLQISKGSNDTYYIDISTKDNRCALISTLTHKRAKDFDDKIVYSSTPFTPSTHI